MPNWNVPGIGEVDRTWVLIAGAGTAGLIGVIWLRHWQQQKKTTQQPQEAYIAGQTGEDPAGNQGVIDPVTGYVYGSAEDQERLGELSIENYADVVYYPSQFVPLTSQEGAGGTESTAGMAGNTGRGKNNQEWLRKAVNAMSEYDRKTVEEALSAVLGGLAVTSHQRDLFLEAVGIVGQPPDGYPKPIRLKDTAAHPEPRRKPPVETHPRHKVRNR